MTEGTGIIFLHKEKFDYYSSAFGRIVEFKFVPEIVRDFDVVNPELLENLIKLFLESNKIPKTEVIIVISDNAAFVKDILPATASGQPINMQEEINKFTESVPFDEVASVTFPMTQGTKVWASNRGMFDVLADAFGKNGCTVTAVLPGILFGKGVSTKEMLDLVSVNTILQNADSVKMEHNLFSKKQPALHLEPKPDVNTRKEAMSDVEVPEDAPEKKSNKRLFIMLGVFVVLIIVLIVVYIGSLNQKL